MVTGTEFSALALGDRMRVFGTDIKLEAGIALLAEPDGASKTPMWRGKARLAGADDLAPCRERCCFRRRNEATKPLAGLL